MELAIRGSMGKILLCVTTRMTNALLKFEKSRR